jgi:flagellar biosynthetic protein FlhB
MAENDQSQEKTEEPTQRRLEKAREEGNVLSSKEMFVFSSSAAGLLALGILGFASKWILQSWSGFFIISTPEELEMFRVSRAFSGLNLILWGTAFFAVPTIIFIILTQIIVGNGIHFTTKAIGFKLEKIDPIKGLGRIFSVKGLVELIKSVAKIVLMLAIVATITWISLPKIIYLSASSLDQGVLVVYRTLLLLIFSILLALLAIGIGDYIWSRHSWLQKLRMSRQDMKEEFKESEGSPEVKSKIRRLQMEASQKAAEQASSIENVKDATVIITNPTHFAVAVKYEPQVDEAPIILAMGKDLIAKRIKEEAKLHDKITIESPVLARALYFTGGIGQAISEQLYTAVAAILAYVYQLERGQDAELQDIDLPKDYIFDENGKNIGK